MGDFTGRIDQLDAIDLDKELNQQNTNRAVGATGAEMFVHLVLKV